MNLLLNSFALAMNLNNNNKAFIVVLSSNHSQASQLAIAELLFRLGEKEIGCPTWSSLTNLGQILFKRKKKHPPWYPYSIIIFQIKNTDISGTETDDTKKIEWKIK